MSKFLQPTRAIAVLVGPFDHLPNETKRRVTGFISHDAYDSLFGMFPQHGMQGKIVAALIARFNEEFQRKVKENPEADPTTLLATCLEGIRIEIESQS